MLNGIRPILGNTMARMFNIASGYIESDFELQNSIYWQERYTF
jgi:hypothetical protein